MAGESLWKSLRFWRGRTGAVNRGEGRAKSNDNHGEVSAKNDDNRGVEGRAKSDDNRGEGRAKNDDHSVKGRIANSQCVKYFRGNIPKWQTRMAETCFSTPKRKYACIVVSCALVVGCLTLITFLSVTGTTKTPEPAIGSDQYQKSVEKLIHEKNGDNKTTSKPAAESAQDGKNVEQPAAESAQDGTNVEHLIHDQNGESATIQECVTDSTSTYKGTVSKTRSGLECQRWDSQSPHKHGHSETLGDQENYCRNPDGEPFPWCYTTSSDIRWEICNIPVCEGTGSVLEKHGRGPVAISLLRENRAGRGRFYCSRGLGVVFQQPSNCRNFILGYTTYVK